MKRFDHTLSPGIGFRCDGWRLSVAHARASGRAVLAEPHNALKVSTALPLVSGLSRMPLFMYRCPNSGYRVQGFVPEDISEDDHVYEPVTCPVCHQIHQVKPAYQRRLGRKGRIRLPHIVPAHPRNRRGRAPAR